MSIQGWRRANGNNVSVEKEIPRNVPGETLKEPGAWWRVIYY